ncbi:MAG: NAD(P)H-dependent oxidoreductase [Solirubrobacteraceae bacterium]|nr:NAD(P)H-dependent oxidoreductase [Solirubrobacteraceae bacterium]
MRVLGISGSLRRGSHNTRLLRAAALQLPPGAQLELFEQLAAVEPYCEDHDGDATPAGAADLRTAIAQSDAMLIATPEYNASLPGQLKNALDWASRPYATNVLRGKPVTVIGASTGIFGAVWAQAEVRKAVGASGALVLGDELPVGQADDAFAPDGSLADPRLRDLLAEAVMKLVDAARPAAATTAA